MRAVEVLRSIVLDRPPTRRREATAAPARCVETDPDGRRCAKDGGHLLPHLSLAVSGAEAHVWPERGPDQALVYIEEDGRLSLLDGARVTHRLDQVRIDYPLGSPWSGSFIARSDSTHSCPAFGTRSTYDELLLAADRQGIEVF